MKKRNIRFFGVWNYEKEEVWLNEMAQKGWLLESKNLFSYHFISVEPDTYQVRMDLLTEGIQSPKDQDYLNFLEETGVEVITHDAGWVYLKKKKDGHPFEIMGDLDSKIAFLKKLNNRLIPILFLQLILMNLAIFTRKSWLAPVMTVISLLALVLAILLVYAVSQISIKQRALEKERMLRE